MISLYLKFSKYINVIIIISLIILIIYSYSHNKYNEGFKDGVKQTTSQMKKRQEEEFLKRLEIEKIKMENNFKILIEEERNNKEIETVYIDKIKEVEKIVFKEHFSCKMTQEEVQQLNQLTR